MHNTHTDTHMQGDHLNPMVHVPRINDYPIRFCALQAYARDKVIGCVIDVVVDQKSKFRDHAPERVVSATKLLNLAKKLALVCLDSSGTAYKNSQCILVGHCSHAPTDRTLSANAHDWPSMYSGVSREGAQGV